MVDTTTGRTAWETYVIRALSRRGVCQKDIQAALEAIRRDREMEETKNV